MVSKPTGINTGVIQYDHGKAHNGSLVRTGALAPPPSVLLQAAQELATKRARSRRDPIIKNIQRINSKIPSLSRFSFPGKARGILYSPDYIHPKPGVSCRECGCDSNRRINLDSNDSDSEAEEDDEPRVVVHRGTIASGELVIKDGRKRNQLAAEHGVLCFETEAAGALADFSCLVIRGISNYCDSHKNDDWKSYAAAVAAAYARQLFFHMPIDQTRYVYMSVRSRAVLTKF